ncbi:MULTISPECIES: hypothetical protein [unclassified Streptomyces]|uniref:hypothetical protein n=1 Tax=unclassified Streptomyces TaxID=2593676 RepID=UPI001F0478E9|nr:MULTISPECIES: hypothetical protein [unclassified Streptomyces]MCH0564003.1 hypothetical protein [Streptomyces sp. MUM 2J]MCH0569670.1 hypothetical protein [Streptomyces sp. MUM 136J]
MDSEEPVCPYCGQHVGMVVRRHKTLGAWVPVWVREPCRNPGCEAYVDPATEERPREAAVVQPTPRAPARTAAATRTAAEAPAGLKPDVLDTGPPDPAERPPGKGIGTEPP